MIFSPPRAAKSTFSAKGWLEETGPAGEAHPARREGGASRPGARARHWPDVGLVAASVTLFYCLFLFQGYRKLFRDSEGLVHVRDQRVARQLRMNLGTIVETPMVKVRLRGGPRGDQLERQPPGVVKHGGEGERSALPLAGTAEAGGVCGAHELWHAQIDDEVRIIQRARALKRGAIFGT